MRFSLVTRLLLIAAAVVLASCGHKSSPPPDNTPASITVTSTNLSLTHGEVSAITGVQVLATVVDGTPAYQAGSIFPES